jgi:hypothetical protein
MKYWNMYEEDLRGELALEEAVDLSQDRLHNE